MLISHDYKFCFIHIGRTGGTSVANSLMDAMGIPNPKAFQGERPELIERAIRKGDEAPSPYLADIVGLKHAPSNMLKEIMGEQKWSKYFKFSFVRNPWDRELSALFKGRHFSGKAGLNSSMLDRQRIAYGLFRRHLLCRRPAKPQSFFLEIGGSLAMDFVGRYENIETDFEQICNYIGLNAKLALRNPQVAPAATMSRCVAGVRRTAF